MKEKQIVEIVEDRFKTINKLYHKIIKEFDKDDIHNFRIEVKKLRAFLRLLDIKKEIDGPLIPKTLKTFYGYIGIIRNIQLHRHSLFKYITDYKTEKPEAYLKILDDEKAYWQKDAKALMEDSNFDEAENKIIKSLPGKLEKLTIKNFAESKLDELKKQLEDLKDDVAIHTTRKILKDIFYNYDYIKKYVDLPETISKKDNLKLLTAQLGDLRDKTIQLEFLSDEYTGKIKDENEKATLLKVKDEFEYEKQMMLHQLQYRFNELRKQLYVQQ
ncbi:MAG: CHAD domain-containing protein [Parafilimonas sp.]